MENKPSTTVKQEENTSYKTESFSLQQKCDYKASDSNIPKRHINSICKSKGVTYQCPDCDYKSTRKGTLERHINSIHLGETFQCQDCKGTSKQRTTML